ncbi:MAG: hypothetical protein KDD60_08470, partial [Bdellovibrionales bacterium]|nr:hypothetical protein [Bdellovibrionales bacterium]
CPIPFLWLRVGSSILSLGIPIAVITSGSLDPAGFADTKIFSKTALFPFYGFVSAVRFCPWDTAVISGYRPKESR